MDGVVKGQSEVGWMTTGMLHSSMRPTAYLTVQTWYKWSRFWTVLVVCHGKCGEWAGWGKVRTSGYIHQNLVYGSTCGLLPAKCASMWEADIIFHWDNISNVGSDIERLGCFQVPMFIHRNDLLATNNHCMHFDIQLVSIQWLLVCH